MNKIEQLKQGLKLAQERDMVHEFVDLCGDVLPDVLEAATLLSEAVEHLDYTGYGDSWERECAQKSKLDERLDAALEKLQ